MIWNRQSEGEGTFGQHTDRMKGFQKSHGGLFDARASLLRAMPVLRLSDKQKDTGGTTIVAWSKLLTLAYVDPLRFSAN